MKRLRTIVHAKFRRRVLGIVLWSVLALTLLDHVVGKATRIPEVSRAIPTTQQAYFDYGRSIEGKLRRMVGANEAQDAPIVGIGWISRDCNGSIPFPVGKLGVAIYGNSFTNRIADQLDELDSRLAIQRLVGPGASPNHSYACFVHRGETATENAPVQIIGVLGSSLRRMLTVSGLTTSFEYPQPFTYPRFTLGPDGHLIPHWPSIRSPDELRSALHDDEKWRSFLFELASLDDFYTSTMMSADFADHSVLLRMLRRAWGQRALRNRTASLHPEAGFDGAPELTAVLRSILIDFARRARAATTGRA